MSAHIPFEKLPPDLQKKAMGYLLTDNFQAAKDLRDQYEIHLQKTMQQKKAKILPSKTSSETPQDKKLSTSA